VLLLAVDAHVDFGLGAAGTGAHLAAGWNAHSLLVTVVDVGGIAVKRRRSRGGVLGWRGGAAASAAGVPSAKLLGRRLIPSSPLGRLDVVGLLSVAEQAVQEVVLDTADRVSVERVNVRPLLERGKLVRLNFVRLSSVEATAPRPRTDLPHHLGGLR
jgi:hypothetical protein